MKEKSLVSAVAVVVVDEEVLLSGRLAVKK